MSAVSALILAGGKATRFGGIAKHELVVEGETIFARQVRVLAPRVAEILVAGPAIEGHIRDVLADARIADARIADAPTADAPTADARLVDARLVDARIADARIAGARIAEAPDADARIAHARIAEAANADARIADAQIADARIAHRSVHDTIAGAGPLAGIAAGLAACRTPWLLVIAGDMPYVTGELVDALIAGVSQTGSHATSGGWSGSGSTPPRSGSDELRAVGGDEQVLGLDAVGVRSRGLPEPLLCVLHVRTLPVIERALAAGRFKASRLLTDEGLRVRWLEAAPEAVRNINAPEDLGAGRGSK